ncbi:MAG TPA: ribonuclease H-like YkuK family protein [Planctomycetota bacterium]|nr:ribonuclease H-like YkuK family protein [Planctomycetota bacterium]
MRMEWRFVTDGRLHDLGEALSAFLAEAGSRDGTGVALHVGTDSKNRGRTTHFVTAVALLHPGRGGRILYRTAREPLMANLAQRLIHETQLSLEVATELASLARSEVVLHIDANPDERHRSSRYARSLAGMGLGCGFEVRLKPHAWCASHVADHVVKEKHFRAA